MQTRSVSGSDVLHAPPILVTPVLLCRMLFKAETKSEGTGGEVLESYGRIGRVVKSCFCANSCHVWRQLSTDQPFPL